MKEKLSWQDVCQKCKKRDSTTKHRSIITKSYMGPCEDSFCYASCDMDTCRPISVTVCDSCTKELSKKK